MSHTVRTICGASITDWIRRLWLPVAGLWLLTVFFRMTELKGWDESFYLAQMNSAILDRDLMLQDDLLAFPNDVGIRIRTVSVLRPEGVLISAFSIGPGLFYGIPMIPAYAAGIEPNGIGFRRTATVWTGFFLILLIIGLDRILRMLDAGPFERAMAIAAAVFSTPFIEYGFRFYMSSHFTATLMATLSILFWMMWLREPRHDIAWAAGLASGWLVITRWQAAAFLGLLALPILLRLLEDGRRTGSRICSCNGFDGRSGIGSGTGSGARSAGSGGKALLRRRITGLVIAVVSAALAVAIQCAVWKLHYGAWIDRPVDENFMNWSMPQAIPFLFSGYHGLIPWAPGIVIGWLGLVLMGFKNRDLVMRWLAWSFAAGMLVQVYVCASTWDWWGGSSYGPRRMTFLLAPVAIGWTFIIRKIPKFWSILVALLAVGWGLFTVCSFFEGVDDLTLLFTGRPDAWRPLVREPVPEGMAAERWQHWKNGYYKRLKSDFRLTEDKRLSHQRQGTLVLAGLMAGAALLVRLLARNRRARLAVLAGVTLYFGFVLVTLLAVFPSNLPWHSHWAAVVRGQPEPDMTGVEPPRDYDMAVRFMHTYNQISRGDGRALLAPDRIYTDGFPGVTLRELSAYALNQDLN